MNVKAGFLFAAAAAFLVLSGFAILLGIISAAYDPTAPNKLYAVAAACFVVSAFFRGCAQ